MHICTFTAVSQINICIAELYDNNYDHTGIWISSFNYMDIKRILKYQEHGDDGLFIEGMHQQEIIVNEYYRLFCRYYYMDF